jgi:hypothetical protein
MIKIVAGMGGCTILDPDVVLNCPVPVYDTLIALLVYAINAIDKLRPLPTLNEMLVGPLGELTLRRFPS